MSINSLASSMEAQNNFFKERNIFRWRLTKNPQWIPLWDNKDYITVHGDRKIEFDKDTKITLSNKKLLIEKSDVVEVIGYDDIIDSIIEPLQRIEKTNGNFVEVNRKVFEKTWAVVASIQEDQTYKIYIDGKIYHFTDQNSVVGFWNSNADVWFDDTTLKVIWWTITTTYSIDGDRLIQMKEERGDDMYIPKFSSDGKVIRRKRGNNSKQIVSVEGKERVTIIEDDSHNSNLSFNKNHIWTRNLKELVIDDKRYDLNKRQWTIADHCEISESGNVVAVDFNYHEEGLGQEIKPKRGKYMLLGDKNGIQKEIKLGEVRIKKIAVDDEWQLAYITQSHRGEKNLVHIGDFQYELDIKNDYHAIQEFLFVGKNTIRIRYLNLQDEMIEKEISLNEDADQVKQKLEADELEAKNAQAIQAWLQNNNIASVEQLQTLLDASKDLAWFQKQINDLWEQSNKTKLELVDIINENEGLTTENKNLQKEVSDLESKIKDIAGGITKWNFGYKISDEAKQLLWLDTKK